MKAILRRLHRLEERHAPAVESEATQYLRGRLEAARLRCGLRPISPERLLELRGMTIVAILHLGRYRASRVRREDEKGAPELE